MASTIDNRSHFLSIGNCGPVGSAGALDARSGLFYTKSDDTEDRGVVSNPPGITHARIETV